LIGHDKDPAMLKEDLNWWRQQQFGMYPRSLNAENIAVIDGLQFTRHESPLQTARETI
jgi:hypothetical protein